MGNFYTVVFSAVAVTAAQDLFEIRAPANGGARIRLHEIGLIQTSDVASADSEVLRVTVLRYTTGATSGSGGSSATPGPIESIYPAATFTAEVNNTTVASAGTATTLIETGWNVLSQMQWSPLIAPDRKPAAVNGEYLVVRTTAPADSLTMSGYIIVEEG